MLRPEIQEKMVWSVDRSSPSSKIRDFMHWSHDIIRDIYYQRKVLANPITKFLIKQWYVKVSTSSSVLSGSILIYTDISCIILHTSIKFYGTSLETVTVR